MAAPPLHDPARLAALARTGLLDSPPEAAFDRLTRLAARFLGVPTVLVSLVTGDRQFFKSTVGLPEPWATERQTPLSHSFCQHVVATGRPLRVENAPDHPLVCENCAVSDIGVIAYLGVPLATADGHILGAFCAIDGRPREWSEADEAALRDFAAMAMTEIDLRGALEAARASETELRRSNRALQEFASVASHDLQEPLRKIQAFGDRLRTRHANALTPEGMECLEKMLGSADRMRALIADLLEYSRVTSKGRPFSPVDLNEVARHVLSDLEEGIARAGGRVEVGNLPKVPADPMQMRQLFQNLIGNALKFRRAGVPPVVAVEAEVGEDALRLTVSDNGIGFEARHAERIFEVFERLHGRGEYEGTGMGLAICRRIAQRHGGDIAARGAPEGGATFVVTLPRRGGPAGETGETGEAREAAGEEGA